MGDLNDIGVLVPKGNQVFIRVSPPKEEKHNGIIVPEACGLNIQDCSGVVEAAGEVTPRIEVGERVLFDISLATDSPLDANVKIVDAAHVIAVLDMETVVEHVDFSPGQYRRKI